MHGNYYHMAVKDGVADLTIYGNISTYDYDERSTSAYKLSKRLEELKNVKRINVNINSLGGDVKEGVAIYNALQRHPAKVVTRCDGWACSIASVIFMAGEERIMYPTSLLMIHNAWTMTWGANAAEMRKLADDLDVITSSSKAAYLEHVNLTEEELTAKMDAETWVTPDDALAWGFATKVEKAKQPPKGEVHQSMAARLFEMLTSLAANGANAAGEDDDDDDSTDADAGTDTDDDTDTSTDGDDDGDGDGGGSDDDPPDPDDDDDNKKDTKNEAAQTMAAFFMSMKN